MDIQQLEENTKIIEQANQVVSQLTEISRVTLMYSNGAPADACMQRIKNIILGESKC
mgnify:CR=1 FL=1